MNAANRKARILVVDDDPDFLESTRTVLEAAGHSVATAGDDQQGLARLEAEKPDLLLLDVMMSRWDSGFQLLWKLKSDDRFASIPVLMLTGVDREMNVDYASHANSGLDADQEYLPVAGYIVKPVEPDKLTATVARVLGEAEKRARPR